jgi:hypothetical protein
MDPHLSEGDPQAKGHPHQSKGDPLAKDQLLGLPELHLMEQGQFFWIMCLIMP